ncbi:membrane protein [Helicobacter pylori]
MKKVFLGMALAISVSMAEKSGAFLGEGFQYSNLENQNTTRTPGANNNTPIDTSIFGNNQTTPAQETQSVSKPDTKVNPSAIWMKK